MILMCMDLDDIGSTIGMLPGDVGVLLGSFSQRRCSCLTGRVTDCLSLTVPILSGSSSASKQDVFAMRSTTVHILEIMTDHRQR